MNLLSTSSQEAYLYVNWAGCQFGFFNRPPTFETDLIQIYSYHGKGSRKACFLKSFLWDALLFCTAKFLKNRCSLWGLTISVLVS